MSYALMQVQGFVGRKPELRSVPGANGTVTNVCNVSVAVDIYAGQDANGQRISKTIWFQPAIWGRDADVAARYLDKGSFVTIDCQVEGLELFQDRNNQMQPQVKLRATIGGLHLGPRLDGQSNGNGATTDNGGYATAGAPQGAPVGAQAASGDDEIPF